MWDDVKKATNILMPFGAVYRRSFDKMSDAKSVRFVGQHRASESANFTKGAKGKAAANVRDRLSHLYDVDVKEDGEQLWISRGEFEGEAKNQDDFHGKR